jgi:hypothetical protein
MQKNLMQPKGPKILHNVTPTNVDGVERAVLNGKYKAFSPPQMGACRRILHDAKRDLTKRFVYPSQTAAYQHELLRLDLLMTFFDI